MTNKVQYIDFENGIDGTGTTGVDWVGNDGRDPLVPRKTVDTAAGLQAGMAVLFKCGTTYDLTASGTRVSTGATINASGGLLFEIGTTSTKAQDRIYVGAYGDKSLGRPVLDGGGTQDTGLSIPASFNGNCSIEDLEITNCLSHGAATSSTNITFNRLYIHDIQANNNDSDGIYVNNTGNNIVITRCIFDHNGADNILIDSDDIHDLTIQNNFFTKVGSFSTDGADCVFLYSYGDAMNMTNNLMWKVSNQKNFIAIERRPADTSTITTGPIIQDNCLCGVGGGAGAISLLGVVGYTVRRNILITPRFIGADQSEGTGRYTEDGDIYSNVFWGIPWVYRPDGTLDGSSIDPDGYADKSVLTGTMSQTTNLVNTLTNNLAYNLKSLVNGGIDTTKAVCYNNLCIRNKNGGLAGLATSTAASGNILYDDGETYDGGGYPDSGGGAPISNIYHDSSSINPTPQRARIDGAFPELNSQFGLVLGQAGYYQGDGSKLTGITDFNQNTFATENDGTNNRCNIGPIKE